MTRLIPILALILATSAHAAPSLSGRTLSCEFNSRLDGRTQTTYRFFISPSGKNTVEVIEDDFNNRDEFLAYSLAGNILTVQDAQYDFSTAPDVSRHFTLTIMPGQGGGDARPIREEINERCTLI